MEELIFFLEFISCIKSLIIGINCELCLLIMFYYFLYLCICLIFISSTYLCFISLFLSTPVKPEECLFISLQNQFLFHPVLSEWLYLNYVHHKILYHKNLTIFIMLFRIHVPLLSRYGTMQFFSKKVWKSHSDV